MSAPSSQHQQTGSFHSHQQTSSEDNAQKAEKWGGGVVLVEIVQLCHFPAKLDGKVYVWLLNNCVKFHTKIFKHWRNFNKSRKEATF